MKDSLDFIWETRVKIKSIVEFYINTNFFLALQFGKLMFRLSSQ